jgi:gentisate 1,2-dioxygenase
MKIYNKIKFFLLITNIIAENICKNSEWHSNTEGQILEYTSNANPPMSEIPIKIFPPELHEHGPSKITPFDLSKELEVNYPATTPNLLANFVRITINQSLPTSVETATSQVFYIIRGSGHSLTRKGTVYWETGDLFVLPFLGDKLTPICQPQSGKNQCVLHTCSQEPITNGCAIYWVNDSPLLEYLGVRPKENNHRTGDSELRFSPSFFNNQEVKSFVNNIQPTNPKDGTPKNRRGVLFGNKYTQQTKTLTPSLWTLLNVISPFDTQRPHKHNSVALDLAISANGTVWTSMGPEIDSDGEIINPINVEWRSGGVFVTPPGWWHSHHNTGTQDAWVLPIQDAGLYTHQRTLDIRFSDVEAKRLRKGKHRGSTIINLVN